ncbi:P-loop containing nucleoside triphosphate hydrolase protein [Exidia glandulosa HHB12029]|uniref:p-loop containing nucleoside triphosphate hydrolase protein n=1 Tax=Exidia glandulosa HHB12029 TaxID=1314781 RepID=A0A165H8L9_EXIGL|nr:P-loop containing nucleoside triphosphate hydrolase protein [Exidia glandulosa HHB12029]
MQRLSFLKPGSLAINPGSLQDRDSDPQLLQAAPAAGRHALPIAKHKDKLLYCVERYPVTIVVGQTGCGKTTPTSVANRVAAEVGCVLGDEVGYTIRFEDVSDKERTRICYMTDGILFRETMIDPLLSRYSVIMSQVDEAHERSLYTDLLLGVLKKIQRKRPSLRLIVSSATLDAKSFLDYFEAGGPGGTATVVSLEGRMFPVEAAYLKEPTPDYVREAVRVVWEIHLQQQPGDILVFLTGREEIDRCMEELAELIPSQPRLAIRMSLLPLHAGLPSDDQLKIFEPSNPSLRKVVVSTNIAEIKTYNPTTALSTLATVPISLASATQRAGRAGRTSSGVCYRLYPESALAALPRTTAPEITRTDLTTPILQLKALGIDDLVKFEWVTNPPAEAVLRALEGLVAAGMVGEDGRLTVDGEKVAECPVEVGIARMLFSSRDYQCGEEILTIAAMVAVQKAPRGRLQSSSGGSSPRRKG